MGDGLLASPKNTKLLTSHGGSSITPPGKTTRKPDNSSLKTASPTPLNKTSTKHADGQTKHTTPTRNPSATSPVIVGDADAGISTCATAGIAIACAVIGAVLAGFVVYFCMRRSKRRNEASLEREQAAGFGPRYSGSGSNATGRNDWTREREKKGSFGAPAGAVVPAGMPPLEQMLPQPVDTTYLTNELSTLQSLIRNHLSNFFHSNTVDRKILADSIRSSAIAETAMDTPFSPDEWIDLLASIKTRTSAIRFIIGWVIFRRLEPECEPTKTLLPPGMNACYRYMLEFAGKNKSAEYLQSKWRVTTGYLLRDQYVTRAFSAGDDRLANLKATSELLDGVLHPLGRQELHIARKDNMNEILRRAASVGFVLASQPSSWIFDWEAPDPSQHPKPLVVFPSLIQHTSERSRNTGEGLEVGSKEVGNSILIS